MTLLHEIQEAIVAFQHHWKFGDMKPVTKISDRQLGDVVIYIRLMQKENGVY